MLILATSDLHGNLPQVPACDVLLIGGDICPLSFDRDITRCFDWLHTDFRAWLLEVPALRIVAIAGNHDFVFEKMHDAINELHLPWTYLRDGSTDIEGLKIWGTPWVPNLTGWAFYGDDATLERKYAMVPEGCDIVLSHGPPFGAGDRLAGRPVRVGAKAANDMMERARPHNLVCGHVHEGYGSYRAYDTDIWNVSFVDEFYTPRGGFIVIPDTRLTRGT